MSDESHNAVTHALEPEVHGVPYLGLDKVIALSQAISLKRLADFLTIGNALVGDVRDAQSEAESLARSVSGAFAEDDAIAAATEAIFNEFQLKPGAIGEPDDALLFATVAIKAAKRFL